VLRTTEARFSRAPVGPTPPRTTELSCLSSRLPGAQSRQAPAPSYTGVKCAMSAGVQWPLYAS